MGTRAETAGQPKAAVIEGVDIRPRYDSDLIPRHDDTGHPSDDAGSMPSASPAQNTSTGAHPSGVDLARADGASFGALAYAAGTLIQVGTTSTPYVSTLGLATGADLGGRSR
jgi:hypothetical protein